MWIIKIGGSLLDYPYLKDWLNVLNQYGAGRVVIVPGGGAFADQVRHQQDQWQFNDQLAHRMALRSMDQYGLMLSDIGLDGDSNLEPVASKSEILKALNNSQIPVWLPAQMLDLDTSIPQNWDMTSDSLAAWLARDLNAERLVLIKIISNEEKAKDRYHEIEGIVDPLFRRFSMGVFQTHILRADQPESLIEMFINSPPSTDQQVSAGMLK